METHTTQPSSPRPERRLGWLKILGIVLLTVVVSVAVTLWIVRTYIFPPEFQPVTLSASEERVLDAKLQRIAPFATNRHQGGAQTSAAEPPPSGDKPLQPEPYSEEGANRTLHFSERELNALLAKNTNLAQRVAIDLSDNLLSARILVPVNEDFPVLGGKTVRARAGLEVAFANGRPIIRLKGVSIMGVPVPNAWLGGLKNIDLIQEYGDREGFWKAFADGIKALKVEDGQLTIELKE